MASSSSSSSSSKVHVKTATELEFAEKVEAFFDYDYTANLFLEEQAYKEFDCQTSIRLASKPQNADPRDVVLIQNLVFLLILVITRRRAMEEKEEEGTRAAVRVAVVFQCPNHHLLRAAQEHQQQQQQQVFTRTFMESFCNGAYQRILQNPCFLATIVQGLPDVSIACMVKTFLRCFEHRHSYEDYEIPPAIDEFMATMDKGRYRTPMEVAWCAASVTFSLGYYKVFPRMFGLFFFPDREWLVVKNLSRMATPQWFHVVQLFQDIAAYTPQTIGESMRSAQRLFREAHAMNASLCGRPLPRFMLPASSSTAAAASPVQEQEQRNKRKRDDEEDA